MQKNILFKVSNALIGDTVIVEVAACNLEHEPLANFVDLQPLHSSVKLATASRISTIQVTFRYIPTCLLGHACDVHAQDAMNHANANATARIQCAPNFLILGLYSR